MSQISTKEQIIKFKDYADIADASYSFLHYVFENERNGQTIIQIKTASINKKFNNLQIKHNKLIIL